jgi:hypothetical protein
MNLAALFMAVVLVESGGVTTLVGDNGRAHGPAQIRQAAVDDYNRWTGSAITLQDCKNLATARRVFFSYIKHYCTKQQIGRQPTMKDAARIWNGGPDGWNESATIHYWQKVKQQLRGKYASNNTRKH